MKMRTRSKLKLAKRCFWCGVFLLALWSVGLFKIALIATVGVMLLLRIVGTLTAKTTPEQPFTINPHYPPPTWKDVHDAVWDMFMENGNDKDEVVLARFLHHINAITDEQSPLVKEAGIAIYSKMAYEHQRKYGSLQYTYNGGLHAITGPETMRPLSDDERVPYVAFCQGQLAAYLKSFETTDNACHQQTEGRSSRDAAA